MFWSLWPYYLTTFTFLLDKKVKGTENISLSTGLQILSLTVISFQKIFGLCVLKCHIVEIWRDVTLVHGRTTDDGQRNVKIGLEFWKQNSQFKLRKQTLKTSVLNTQLKMFFRRALYKFF